MWVIKDCMPWLDARTRSGRAALAAAISCLAPWTNAFAHGIAGNRYFPGTLTFDDPAVADEFLVNSMQTSISQAGSEQRQNDLGISGARLLTPTLGLGFDLGRSRVRAGDVASSNQRGSDIFLKTELHRDDLNEELVSGSLGYGTTRTDLPGPGSSSRHAVLPGITFGKGFGNLPDSLDWLRPFAIAGAVAAELPTGSSSNVALVPPKARDFAESQARNVETLHWGFAIEYSMLYRTSRFTPGKLPAEEPLHQFVPLVEFQFDSPRGGRTMGTMNPGISYVAQTWQFAIEAVIPIVGDGPRHPVGARAQLLWFLDDLIPSAFGKPLLER
jgi:hypothetical protein